MEDSKKDISLSKKEKVDSLSLFLEKRKDENSHKRFEKQTSMSKFLIKEKKGASLAEGSVKINNTEQEQIELDDDIEVIDGQDSGAKGRYGWLKRKELSKENDISHADTSKHCREKKPKRRQEESEGEDEDEIDSSFEHHSAALFLGKDLDIKEEMIQTVKKKKRSREMDLKHRLSGTSACFHLSTSSNLTFRFHKQRRRGTSL